MGGVQGREGKDGGRNERRKDGGRNERRKDGGGGMRGEWVNERVFV